MTHVDGRDPDLYENQIPPHAPGIPGNGEIEDDGVDHGVAADGFVAVEPEAAEVEAVAPVVSEDVPPVAPVESTDGE